MVRKSSKGVSRARGSNASPSDNLHWPVFTVEEKGAAGQLRKARRQNLHNASVMINNFFELKKRTGSPELSFGQAIVITMELTAEVAQLNCHWPSRSINGDVIYHRRALESWSLYSPRLATYREARRSISNAVDHTANKYQVMLAGFPSQDAPPRQILVLHTSRYKFRVQKGNQKLCCHYLQQLAGAKKRRACRKIREER